MKELDVFNNSYKGKVINWCELWWNTINFNPEEMTFCCSSTMGKTPDIKIDEASLEGFDKEAFVKETIRLIRESQDDCKKGCYGCEQLHKMAFDGVSYEDIKIKNVSWNHFRGCNSRCVYCDDGGRPIHVYYEAKPLLERLVAENAVADKVSISFGGGEPTLVPNLEEYIKYGSLHGWKQLLNTNALLCKDYIIEALRDPNFSLQVSVDAGTAETYRKIKGQNGYDRVWKTIRRYCESEGRVFVKYIVFSWNSSRQEIDAFIAKMIESGGENIVISGESVSGWKIEECEWEFGEKEVEGCAYLMQKAAENNFAIYLNRGNFSKQDCGNILKMFMEEYIKPKVQAAPVFIWGMGEYGRRLADAFMGNGISVSGFGDRDSAKWGSRYRDIPCMSLKGLLDKVGGDRAFVFVALAEYEDACKEIKKHAGLDVCVVNLA